MLDGTSPHPAQSSLVTPAAVVGQVKAEMELGSEWVKPDAVKLSLWFYVLEKVPAQDWQKFVDNLTGDLRYTWRHEHEHGHQPESFLKIVKSAIERLAPAKTKLHDHPDGQAAVVYHNAQKPDAPMTEIAYHYYGQPSVQSRGGLRASTLRFVAGELTLLRVLITPTKPHMFGNGFCRLWYQEAPKPGALPAADAWQVAKGELVAASHQGKPLPLLRRIDWEVEFENLRNATPNLTQPSLWAGPR